MKLHSLEQLIYDDSLKTFLLDAYGVLYSEDGPIPGAAEATQKILEMGKKIFVATNNTSMSIPELAKRFQRWNMPIPAENIISSGLGLAFDETVQPLIRGKKVYAHGWKTSDWYVAEAGGEITKDLDAAETIALLASDGNRGVEDFEAIVARAKADSSLPIICANPDQYVMFHGARHPVVGYFATWVAMQLGREIYWFGKPFSNFSRLVNCKLTQAGILVNKSICFCDDNPENVRQLIKDLDVTGCCVVETGLAAGTVETSQQPTAQRVDRWIPRFSLH